MTYFLKEDLLNMHVGLAGFSLITSFFSKRDQKTKQKRLCKLVVLSIFYHIYSKYILFKHNILCSFSMVTGYEIIFFKYII